MKGSLVVEFLFRSRFRDIEVSLCKCHAYHVMWLFMDEAYLSRFGPGSSSGSPPQPRFGSRFSLGGQRTGLNRTSATLDVTLFHQQTYIRKTQIDLVLLRVA